MLKILIKNIFFFAELYFDSKKWSLKLHNCIFMIRLDRWKFLSLADVSDETYSGACCHDPAKTSRPKAWTCCFLSWFFLIFDQKGAESDGLLWVGVFVNGGSSLSADDFRGLEICWSISSAGWLTCWVLQKGCVFGKS